MTRTLSVAGFVVVVLLAIWIQRTVGGSGPAMPERSAPPAAVAVPGPAQSDPAMLAADELAAWPIAASR